MRIDESHDGREGGEGEVPFGELLSEGGAQAPEGPRQRQRFVTIAVALTLIGAIIGVSWLESRGADTSTTSGISVADFRAQARVDGSPAPGFTLPMLDRRGTLALGAFRGKVVVLNFWASWCPPCRQEAPDLEAAWRDYRSKGVQFLGVDERDNTAAARAFQDAFGITYPSGFDPAGSLADDYGIVGLPSTFLIDPNGQIVYKFTGYLDGPVLRSALDEALGRTTG